MCACVCVVSFTCAALPACVKMQKMFFFSLALCRFAFCVDFAATYFCLIKYFVSNQRILLAFSSLSSVLRPKVKVFRSAKKKKRKRKSERKDCCELWFCLCNFNNQLHTALLSFIECVRGRRMLCISLSISLFKLAHCRLGNTNNNGARHTQCTQWVRTDNGQSSLSPSLSLPFSFGKQRAQKAEAAQSNWQMSKVRSLPPLPSSTTLLLSLKSLNGDFSQWFDLCAEDIQLFRAISASLFTPHANEIVFLFVSLSLLYRLACFLCFAHTRVLLFTRFLPFSVIRFAFSCLTFRFSLF